MGIKNLDIFGHPIALNFNKEGTSYQTWIGGVFTLLIYVFTLLFVAYKSNVLYNNLDDSLQSGQSLTDFENLP